MFNIFDRLMVISLVFLVGVLLLASLVLTFGDRGSVKYDAILATCAVLVLVTTASWVLLSTLARKRREAWQRSVLTTENVLQVIHLRPPGPLHLNDDGQLFVQALLHESGVGPYNYLELLDAVVAVDRYGGNSGVEGLLDGQQTDLLHWNPKQTHWELTPTLKHEVYEWAWELERVQRRIRRREQRVA